jgi:uncharacterized glyoxalase superfamily protein PhnB
VLQNRSIPHCTVIPELAYPDVVEAMRWLCDAFGFTLRIQIGNHHVQLNVGDGAVVLTERGMNKETAGPNRDRTSMMVRVSDVDSHHERARKHGARIVRPPADYPYDERQYTVEDFDGHRWTFTQSIADVDPKEWGGIPGPL